jgi:streptogramin lyase
VFLEDAGTVLVSNLNSGRIDRYDAESGAFIDIFASGLGGPTRMKIGADGLLYVLQWTGNGRVRRFQLDGTPLGDFTTAGVTQAIGLDWDSNGNLYVSSYNGDHVRRFGPDGSDLGLFIQSNLVGPTNLYFEADGNLLVLDYDGGAVKRFSAAGAYLGVFIGGLSQSEGIAELPNGDLLIGNGGTGAVKRYTAQGAFIEDLVAGGTAGLVRPNAVVLREPPADEFAITASIADAWYNPATSGQGFLITVFPTIEQVFLAWFTYEVERPDSESTALLGEPGHRWLTAQGAFAGDTATLTLFETVGGVFDGVAPKPSTDQAGVGTLTLQFADCRSGLAEYEIPSLNLSGQIPLQRIVEDRVTQCESEVLAR